MTDALNLITPEACCAHMRVKYNTASTPQGGTIGWWACQDCGQRFMPIIHQHAAVQPVFDDEGNCIHSGNQLKEALQCAGNFITALLPSLAGNNLQQAKETLEVIKGAISATASSDTLNDLPKEIEAIIRRVVVPQYTAEEEVHEAIDAMIGLFHGEHPYDDQKMAYQVGYADAKEKYGKTSEITDTEQAKLEFIARWPDAQTFTQIYNTEEEARMHCPDRSRIAPLYREPLWNENIDKELAENKLDKPTEYAEGLNYGIDVAKIIIQRGLYAPFGVKSAPMRESSELYKRYAGALKTIRSLDDWDDISLAKRVALQALSEIEGQ